jgi:integrase
MTKTDYINVSTLVRQPLDYAVEMDILEYNPMRKVKIEPRVFKPERKKSSESQVFTRQEVAALSEAAWNDLDNEKLVYNLSPLAFLFMFQTGLRIGEVCAVRYEDIEGGELHLQRSVERDTKTIKDGLKGVRTERWVMLSSEAVRIIEEARKRQNAAGVSSEGYIFSMTEDYIPYRAVSETFRKYCKKTGIRYRSSHKARKTYISTLIDGGMNINTIREMVGHADERTTLNSYCYDRHTKDERRDILEKALDLETVSVKFFDERSATMSCRPKYQKGINDRIQEFSKG